MAKPERKFNYALPIIVILIILVVGAALLVGSNNKKPVHKQTASNPKDVSTSCGPYRKDGIMTLDSHSFNVEIAYTDKAKQTGLAGRPCIESNWGMLFDFGKEGQYAFWMKGMSFPIDIIWINSAHTIAAIESDIQPSTYNSKNPYFENDPQHPARYVLEIKANQSKQLNLDLGQSVHFQQL